MWLKSSPLLSSCVAPSFHPPPTPASHPRHLLGTPSYTHPDRMASISPSPFFPQPGMQHAEGTDGNTEILVRFLVSCTYATTLLQATGPLQSSQSTPQRVQGCCTTAHVPCPPNFAPSGLRLSTRLLESLPTRIQTFEAARMHYVI
jgi:hypothetical protein